MENIPEKVEIDIKKKRTRRNIVPILIFLVGLGIFIYPIISRFYYTVKSTTAVSNYESEKAKLTAKEVEERMELAFYYNSALNNSSKNFEDPYSDEQRKEGLANYAKMLELHEKIGRVEIPSLKLDLPIYAGTSDYVLQMGAGHLEGTSLPVGGESSHSVITAHRGLPNNKLFTDLNLLKEGDLFLVHNIRDVLCYQVDSITVIEPDNLESLLVVPNEDYCTLLTCTPYMVNSHRLLVRGKRIPYEPEIQKQIEESKTYYSKETLITIGLACLILLILIIIIIKRIRVRRRRREINGGN